MAKICPRLCADVSNRNFRPLLSPHSLAESRLHRPQSTEPRHPRPHPPRQSINPPRNERRRGERCGGDTRFHHPPIARHPLVRPRRRYHRRRPVENHPPLRRVARLALGTAAPVAPFAVFSLDSRARVWHLRPDGPGRCAAREEVRPHRPAIRE